MSIEITSRQAEVLAYIKGFQAQNGFPPTREEIKDAFGFNCVNSAQCHLKALIKKGYIERVPGISRGLKIVRDHA